MSNQHQRRRSAKNARRKARIAGRDHRAAGPTEQPWHQIPVWDYRRIAAEYAATHGGEGERELLDELLAAPMLLGQPDDTVNEVHLVLDQLKHWEQQRSEGRIGYDPDTRTHWVIPPVDPEVERILIDRGWTLAMRDNGTDQYDWPPSLHPVDNPEDRNDVTYLEVTKDGNGHLAYGVYDVGRRNDVFTPERSYASMADLLAGIDDVESIRLPR